MGWSCCPLSPFLFVILIEPLVVNIRQNPEIAPINIKGSIHHLSLHADDIILYISRPQTSVPPLMSLITKFGTLSGFTINWDKSELMLITSNVNVNFLQTIPFKKAYDKFSCLGITKNPEDLLQVNWHNKIEQVKKCIEFWKTLSISLTGRINAIKMIALPRFLHLFQSLPCFITQSHFKQLDSIIIPFLWNYRSVRIAKKHLIKPKQIGGFALPHFKKYYWAAQLTVFSWWTRGPSPDESHSCPKWLSLERSLCHKTSLPALVNSPATMKKSNYSDSFVIENALKIWKQIRSYIKAPNIYTDSPICHNHSFIPGLQDIAFSSWYQQGICNIQDMYLVGNFATFAQLQEVYGIQASNFFRYLKIRDFIRKYIPNFEKLNTHDVLEEIKKFKPENRGAISYFYQILDKQATPNTITLKQVWAEELNEEIEDEVWKECLMNIHDCSFNVRLNLIQFKTLHRLYYSRTKLHRIFPDVSPLCNRCRCGEGTLTHLLWSCNKLHTLEEHLSMLL
ncbi:hypothetical protein LDENG_00131610 [Lucifuga dentata]|nr:hypothetical protein LDENG_00131610 [Lucifuga dentata]